MSSFYPSQSTFCALTILTFWLSLYNSIFFISLYQCFVFCYITYRGFSRSLDSVFSPVLTSSLGVRQAAHQTFPLTIEDMAKIQKARNKVWT